MFSEEDKDLYAIMFTGPIFLLGVLGGASAWIGVKGKIATAWMIQNNILVTKEEALIPILDAGLDLARVVLIAAVIFLVLWAAIASTRRKLKGA